MDSFPPLSESRAFLMKSLLIWNGVKQRCHYINLYGKFLVFSEPKINLSGFSDTMRHSLLMDAQNKFFKKAIQREMLGDTGHRSGGWMLRCCVWFSGRSWAGLSPCSGWRVEGSLLTAPRKINAERYFCFLPFPVKVEILFRFPLVRH